jgi:uncharacterized membrane protein (UPF0136 family)
MWSGGVIVTLISVTSQLYEKSYLNYFNPRQGEASFASGCIIYVLSASNLKSYSTMPLIPIKISTMGVISRMYIYVVYML